MPRFIVVDSRTEAFYGDTASLAGREIASATDAACLFDRERGRAPRGFGLVRKGSPSASLDVYRVRGGEAPENPCEGGTLDLYLGHADHDVSLVTYNS
jgi:hypothetical protein